MTEPVGEKPKLTVGGVILTIIVLGGLGFLLYNAITLISL